MGGGDGSDAPERRHGSHESQAFERPNEQTRALDVDVCTLISTAGERTHHYISTKAYLNFKNSCKHNADPSS